MTAWPYAATISSASLHEAAGRRGALPSSIKPIDRRMSVEGPALPVRCPPGDNLWIHRALAQVKPGDVLVVECGPGTEFGYWGEIMATSAIALGAAGLVITGGVRDSLQLIDLGLPTFAGAICIQGTGKDPGGDGAVGEPVRIGAVTVRRGDLVVGDADGVIILPAADAPALVQAARDRDAKEAGILERVRAGALTLDVYKL
ncbi:4-hydroxy-4-methyl-2-oxoglutarate aldolase [Niveispirillum sp.]|uniref:RraA family protein n=1 Tax=Niveispirillum sp. TaxID=1917217 RepID=UPI001B4EFB5A|nr:4-hydroxy-4-methyl-2-oxoglutarate aldolase [Niveispirillum sp.]MBP7339140.1 4-hydroxy-4-methyl-2-oxoglutarate aldolase [Niveispirillum sp.]